MESIKKKTNMEKYYQTKYNSPIGLITLLACEKGLTGLIIEGQSFDYKKISKEEIEDKDDFGILIETKKWLDDYFNNLKPNIHLLKLNINGSAFQKDVWNILLKIPYGEVISYNDIAKEIAFKYKINKMSAQAVGGAVGHNPISIIIPCHRVIGSKGSLTGYGGEIDLKVKLLNHENVDMTNIYY